MSPLCNQYLCLPLLLWKQWKMNWVVLVSLFLYVYIIHYISFYSITRQFSQSHNNTWDRRIHSVNKVCLKKKKHEWKQEQASATQVIRHPLTNVTMEIRFVHKAWPDSFLSWRRYLEGPSSFISENLWKKFGDIHYPINKWQGKKRGSKWEERNPKTFWFQL